MRKTITVLSALIFTVSALTGCAASHKEYLYSKGAVKDIVEHRIGKGDSLWKISRRYGIKDISQIVKLNRFGNSLKIRSGQILALPGYAKLRQESVFSDEKNYFIWPVKGKIVCWFGERYSDILNNGINIEPAADAHILAARSGRVVFFSPDFNKFGKTVIIDHGDGFFTVYALNSEVFIKAGDEVKKGGLIARIKSNASSRNYLHFEIRKGYRPQNPVFYLPA